MKFVVLYWGYQKYGLPFWATKNKKNPVLGDKRQKFTQASKANKIIY